MKTQLFIGAIALAVSQMAMAGPPGGGGGGGGGVVITGTGTSNQQTSAGVSLVYNHSVGSHSEATQSISSNVSDINIGGTSTQSTLLIGSSLANVSNGGDAVQNVSSNADTVNIDGTSEQTTNMVVSSAHNIAGGDGSYATQNMSSNFGEVAIEKGSTSTQMTNLLFGSNVKNESNGSRSYAAQNLSSNFGHVTVSGTSTQTTTIAFSSAVNLATGEESAARQSLSTNSSCTVDQTCTGLKPKYH